MRTSAWAWLAVVVAAGLGCKNSKYCDSSTSMCPTGTICDLVMHACVVSDGGVDRTDGSDGSDGSDASDASDGSDDVPPPCTASSCSGATPVCDNATKMCRACGPANECATLDPAAPACSSSGACVECIGNGDCTTQTKPICRTTSNTCRACQADSECATGPGVCMAHQDGRCATDAETIYVQNAAGCSNTGSGTPTMPFCAMDPAFAATGAARDLIIVRGTVVNGATSGFAAGAQQISIVGQMSAALAGAPAIHLASGDVYVRNVKLSTGASIGCQADTGATIRLDHVLVTGNSGGGILLDGAAFDIENTTVTNNGPGTLGPTTWGGVFVNGLPTSGPARLQLLTVQSNMGGGFTCSMAVTDTTGVLASANTLGLDISTSCGFMSCASGPNCGAQP